MSTAPRRLREAADRWASYGEPEVAARLRKAAASLEFDEKYRRCEEHNRARYWCGCYQPDKR